MINHRHRWGYVCALALAGTSVICGCSAGGEPAPIAHQIDEPLIAGVPANGARLNAIGSVGVAFSNSVGETQYEAYCSASLIGKQTVLTAKHCVQFFSRDYAAGLKTVFAVGPDASAPVKLLEVVAVEGAPGDEGGFAGHGRDVGVMYLGERASELTPLEIGGLRAQDLDKKFIEIGYGTRDNTGAHGTRRAGNVTLRATQGRIPEIIFGTFERFKAWYETGSPNTNALFATGPVAPVAFLPIARSLREQVDPTPGNESGDDLDAYLHYLYENLVLSEGDEAIFGGTLGDAQSCYGDSGAPILRVDAKGSFIAYGVVSAGVGSNQLVCDYGGIDAVFGPEVQTFLASAQKWVDPCKGVSVGGKCNGKTVQRCTSPFEGPRRLVKFNCGSLGQVCAVQPDGSAGCTDP
ncbi:MAG TPA: trypsin-like serine protease [Polyangiaceae bacterium]|nr:trypsin-like serine protease [Polyangiaceae bacterium]